MVDQSRRRFLKTAAILPFAATAGCASTQLKQEMDYASNVNLIASVGSAPCFNKQDAIDNLGVAMLPEMYEHRVLTTKQATHEETMQAMRDRMPKDAEVTLIRHGHTTSVLVYRPKEHKLTIAFDGTQEAGDIMDHFKFLAVDHKLGGTVHWGYRDAIELPGNADYPGKLCDHLRKVVADYSERDGKLDVTLTGFSRGGTLATALAAEWFAEGIPGGDKTHLGNVQTFAAMPYGKGDFIKNYEAAAKKHGTLLTQLIAGTDTVPFLTDYTLSPYKMAGNILYFIPNTKTGITDVLANPSKEELKTRQAALEKRDWHDLNIFASLFGARDSHVDYDIAQLPQRQKAVIEMQRRSISDAAAFTR